MHYEKTTKPLPQDRYCAYVDVLGFGTFVTSRGHSDDEKLRLINDLNDLYKCLFASTSFSVKHLNSNSNDTVFIKSFSDCFYIEASDPLHLLYLLYYIFNVTFGYFKNFPEDSYRPLLRAGVVKGWTEKFIDIDSMSRQPIENILGKPDYISNPVGPGLAQAYYVSEKSNLSGMRILISDEVIKQISLQPYNNVSFECCFTECMDYMALKEPIPNVKLFFFPVTENEKHESIKLHELCWPVFKP